MKRKRPREIAAIPCQCCGSLKSKVIDTARIKVSRRPKGKHKAIGGLAIRRWRKCKECGKKYKTIETYLEDLLL